MRASRGRGAARTRNGLARLLAIPGFIALYLACSRFAPIPAWVPALYLLASVAAFVAYAVDKSAARRGAWRTSEAALHVLGLAGGWPGALLAQQWLRHKTAKPSFLAVFWLTVIVNMALFLAWRSPLLRPFLA